MEVEVAQDFAEVQKQEIYHYCKEKHFIYNLFIWKIQVYNYLQIVRN